MAPARHSKEDDDPVTAEYDVYLTDTQAEQIYLLQYLNRTRERPYSQRFGAKPTDFRLKPKTGHLELDVELSTSYNFNKYQALKWGDAIQTAKTIQNESATYGPAAGLGLPRGRPGGGRGGGLKDKADRENQLSNDLANFHSAEMENRVLQKQTLGGQIHRHDNSSAAAAASPVYFLGAFQGNQLHLSKVDGTVQMRPQFHHIDAEDHRNRLAVSRAQAAAEGDGPSARPAPVARGIQQSYKEISDDKDKDAPERLMRKALQDAEEEAWVALEYVDESEDRAFECFSERMFVHESEKGWGTQLKSGMDDDQYLDAVSMPRFESPTRRRKRKPSRKEVVDVDDGDEADGEGEPGTTEKAEERDEGVATAAAQAEGDAMEGVET